MLVRRSVATAARHGRLSRAGAGRRRRVLVGGRPAGGVEYRGDGGAHLQHNAAGGSSGARRPRPACRRSGVPPARNVDPTT